MVLLPMAASWGCRLANDAASFHSLRRAYSVGTDREVRRSGPNMPMTASSGLRAGSAGSAS
jgi:hypothetical protein